MPVLLPTCARDTPPPDFFNDVSHQDVFLVHDDGYRTRRATYRQVPTTARSFAMRVEGTGVLLDHKFVICAPALIDRRSA
jgi:hypothetical protein